MNQTEQLVGSLKKVLRAKGLTYKDVAIALKLSEASIKRNFSENTFTLSRLEDICNLIDINFYEVARLTSMYKEDRKRILSIAQEQELAKDSLLFTYFYHLLNGWTHRQLIKKLSLDEIGSIKQLTALDNIGLIELLPGNKVRLLTAQTIKWRDDGPIRKLYKNQVLSEFLDSNFKKDNETMHFETAELSPASINTLQRKIDLLVKEMEEFAELDHTVPEEEKISVGMLVGIRPWVFSLIGNRKKK